MFSKFSSDTMVRRGAGDLGEDKPWMGDVRLAVASVDESSKLARNLFTYFLTAGLFVAVTVGGTTDRDLLLDSPVILPIVGTAVPLTAFYAVAPLLLVAFHLNLLIKLWQLKLKAGTREAALPEGEARVAFRELLFPFDFTTLVAGPKQRWFTRFLVGMVMLLTVFLGPFLLIWFVQHRFATGGDMGLMPFHIGLLSLDVLAMVLLRIGLGGRGFLGRVFAWGQAALILLAFAVVPLGALVRGMEEVPAAVPDPVVEALRPRLEVTNDCLVNEQVLPTFCDDYARQVWLDGPADAASGDDPAARGEAWLARQVQILCQDGRRLDLEGRQLQEAVFAGTMMPCAVLARSDLTGANLGDANLTGANLRDATLTGRADLMDATLTDADLYGATLTGANLLGATLTGASLVDATLTDADLGGATLTGADLWNATLTGASLYGATLTGASLWDATLTGANLERATLTGASLYVATLTGADLMEASLTGANLERATLTGADLSGATLTGANLWNATLTGAFLGDASGWVFPQARYAIFSASDWSDVAIDADNLLVLSGACFAALWPREEKDYWGRRLAFCGEGYWLPLLRAPDLTELPDNQRAFLESRIRPDDDSGALARAAVLPDNVREQFRTRACFHESTPPVDTDGQPMTTEDMPLCSDPSVAARYRLWECGQLHFRGDDPWTGPGDPFAATPESCAGTPWGTPDQDAWLRETFDDAPWQD